VRSPPRAPDNARWCAPAPTTLSACSRSAELQIPLLRAASTSSTSGVQLPRSQSITSRRRSPPNDAFEVSVLDRVVFDLHRQSLRLRIGVMDLRTAQDSSTPLVLETAGRSADGWRGAFGRKRIDRGPWTRRLSLPARRFLKSRLRLYCRVACVLLISRRPSSGGPV